MKLETQLGYVCNAEEIKAFYSALTRSMKFPHECNRQPAVKHIFSIDLWWGAREMIPVGLTIDQNLPQGIVFGTFSQLHEDVGLASWILEEIRLSYV